VVIALIVGLEAAGDDDEPPAATVALGQATIERRDLRTAEQLDGTVEQTATLTISHQTEVSADAGTGAGGGQPTAGGGVGGGGRPTPPGGPGSTQPSTAPTTTSSSTVPSTPPPSTPAPSTPQLPQPTTPTTSPVEPTTTSATSQPTTTAEPTTTVTPSPTTAPQPATTTTLTTTTTPEPTTRQESTTTGTTTVTTEPTAPPDTTVTTEPTAPPDTTATTSAVVPTSPDATMTATVRLAAFAPAGVATAGEAEPVAATDDGTGALTSIVADGATVALGDVLYTVDDQPVVVLYGALPAWRTMSTASDDGPDVRQLEESLFSLGYDPDSEITIDEEYDDATSDAVRAWQADLGVEQTGEVTLGTVVFIPAASTVSSHAIEVGASVSDGTAILTIPSAGYQVVAEVPAELRSSVLPGSDVEIEGQPGAVSRLRSSTSDSGAAVVEAVIPLNEPIDGAPGGAPVDVSVTVERAADVLAVPAEALVSRLDGSYALQVAREGDFSYVPVEVGDSAGGWVAVESDELSEGMSVTIPA
jgi:Putative peptidoglycan binding domain